jgi:hypothetical protein
MTLFVTCCRVDGVTLIPTPSKLYVQLIVTGEAGWLASWLALKKCFDVS